MAKIISHVRFGVAASKTGTLLQTPGEMVDKWAEGFKNRAKFINEHRKARIPDGERFGARLAGVSSKAYRQVINPAFVSRAGASAQDIINRQAANLDQSFKKYDEGLDFVYQTVDGVEAKRFKEKVDAGREHYAEGMARKTTPFTGIPGSRGPVVLAGLWLTADPITEGEIRGNDQILEGNPILITKPESRAAFKGALIPRLQQAGAAILDGGFGQAIMQAHNDITNEIVQGFVNKALQLVPFSTGGESHVDYLVETGVFYIDIQVAHKGA